MIKTVITAIYTSALFATGFFIESSTNILGVMMWSDIGIVKQVSIITGLSLMVIVAIVAVKTLSSIWVRKGYEGVDKILDGSEVSLMISHVIAFVAIDSFIFMLTFRQELDPPMIAWWICSGGFLAPEIYMGIAAIFKIGKKKE
jgi:hypothetical protein